MAGLCDYKTLLLFAGIICQIPTTAVSNYTNTGRIPTIAEWGYWNPATSSPTLTSNETSPTTSIKSDPQITASPADTHSNTTVTKNNKARTAAPVQCSYTVTPIEFGFKIDIKGSTNGNYSITVSEEGRPVIRTSVVHSVHQTSHEIKQQKPCTEYELHVKFIESDGSETSCNNDKTREKTLEMRKEEIKVTNCRPGYVCYQSDKDISFSLSSNHVSPETCTSDDKTLCIKPGFNDYCSDLTTTFTSGSCSLNLTTSITVDFLNPSDINQSIPTKLPAKIDPVFPPNCRNLSIDYTCSHEFNEPKILSDLEPFTDYYCTGQIKENGVDTNKRTSVRFKVDCDLAIIYTKKSTTTTSIELSWDTISANCADVPELKNLYYDCSCTNANQKHTFNKHPSGGTCQFTGLKPFTSYTCKVQPTYNNKDVSEPEEVTVKTEAGIPEDINQLTVDVPEHNVITVKCKAPSSFHGPVNRYIARLRYGSDTLHERNGTKCHFEFKDLSYSTTYKLEVSAFNGHFESRPWTEEVSTLYNEKAVISLIIFIIIIISAAVVFFSIKIYRKHRQSTDSEDHVYENMMLEPFYVNARPPGCDRKGTNP